MKIVLDAGHGPDTPGKRCQDGSLREYQFNSAVARYLAGLFFDFEGVEILYTHDHSRDVPLNERTNKANAWCADLFVSIHANAYGADWSSAGGIETFVYISRPPSAVALANAVQRQLIQETGLQDRGVKSADFHVLRETGATAILVECGFMTNRTEAELLKSDEYRRKCAAAIVAGIAETYGLKKKEEEEDMAKIEELEGEIQTALNTLEAHIELINTQAARITDLESKASQPVPEWAREPVDAAVAAGMIDTDVPIVGSYDFYRFLAAMHKAGKL